MCNYPGCDNETTDKSQYCSKTCRDRYSKLKRRIEKAAADEINREGQRAFDLELSKNLTSKLRSEAKKRDYTTLLRDSLSTFSPSTPVPFKSDPNKATVDWVIHFTDWHVGQRTSQEHTGGLYEQSTEITKYQVDKLLEHEFSIFDVESKSKNIRKIWHPITGDIVEGDSMRPAQLRQIDMPVTQQTIEVFDILCKYIRSELTLPGIEEIIIDVVGGNHDRTTPKAGNAGLGESDYCDTYSWLIGAMLERVFADEPRVSVTNWDTFFGYRKFGGLRHAFEHGATIRGGGGFIGMPFYPIVNTARKYESMLDGVDVVWFGHFHQPAIAPLGKRGWVISGGALPATTHFVQSSFKSIREPTQWLVEIHEEHGITGFIPLYAPTPALRKTKIWK